jgi:virulence factor Mce-like protein
MRKSFVDRNPFAVAVASVLVIGALTGFAFAVGTLHLFEKSYTLTAELSDAAGVRGGDDVRVAGVKAGRVSEVELDRRRGTVIVQLVVNGGVDLGPETRAEVALATLLGKRYVRLSGPVARPYLADLPKERRAIPLSRTRIPFDIFEFSKRATHNIQVTDTVALNRFLTSVADITEGKQAQISEILTGVDRLSRAINERKVQLQSLIDRAKTLTRTLADKDETLVALVEQSERILNFISDKRDQIDAAFRSGAASVNEMARLLRTNKGQLDFLLTSLHPALDVLARHPDDLNRAFAWLGPAIYQTKEFYNNGPWWDVYLRGAGPDVVQFLQRLNAPPGGQP